MRLETPIDFLTLVPGQYNEETGNYDNDTYKHDVKRAQVYDASAVTKRHEYGEYRQGDLVVSILGHLGYTPDSAVVNGIRYSIEDTRLLRRIQTFHLSQIQEGRT